MCNLSCLVAPIGNGAGHTWNNDSSSSVTNAFLSRGAMTTHLTRGGCRPINRAKLIIFRRTICLPATRIGHLRAAKRYTATSIEGDKIAVRLGNSGIARLVAALRHWHSYSAENVTDGDKSLCFGIRRSAEWPFAPEIVIDYAFRASADTITTNSFILFAFISR